MVIYRFYLVFFITFLFVFPCLAQTDSLYEVAIQKADSAYEFKWLKLPENPSDIDKYESAKAIYKKALELKPKNNYATSRIREIDYILYDLKNKPLYKMLISAGDSLLKAMNFQDALKSYQRADALYSTGDTRNKLLLLQEGLTITETDSMYEFIFSVLKADSLLKKI